MNEFADKTAIVSGASSGIGLAISQALLQQQCRVIGIARDFSKATSLKTPLFEAHEQDLTELNQSSSLIKSLCKNQPIDFFIHSAGFGLFGSIEQFSVRQIDDYLRSNLTAALVMSQQLVPAMRRQKSGRLIFIGSESALAAGRKGALYSAAKFGLRGFTQALREDCAKDGIGVSLINPGMVETPFFDEQSFRPGKLPGNAIDPSDIADTVLHILRSNPNIVFDEINLSPRNKSIDFK
jgi:short-subunit dehydrogenase